MLPAGEQPKAWLYTFGDPSRTDPEAINGELIADPKMLRPDVLVKLLLALSFYESGLREKARRVCQRNFYLRVRSNAIGKRLFAAEIYPKVEPAGNTLTLTIRVKTTKFAKVDPAKVRRPELGAYL